MLGLNGTEGCNVANEDEKWEAVAVASACKDEDVKASVSNVPGFSQHLLRSESSAGSLSLKATRREGVMCREFLQDRDSSTPSCLGDARSRDTSSISSDTESAASPLGVISDVVTESVDPGSGEGLGLSATGAAVLPHIENNPKTPEDTVGVGVRVGMGLILDGS